MYFLLFLSLLLLQQNKENTLLANENYEFAMSKILVSVLESK